MEFLELATSRYSVRDFSPKPVEEEKIGKILEAAKVAKGSKEPNRSKVGSLTWDAVRGIAENKMKDMNCFTVESAMSMVAGTARSMGVKVTGESPLKKD